MEYWAGSLAALAALGFSARYTWWRRRLSGIPVLMYHHITDDLKGTPLPKLRVSPDRFAKQLDYLQARGYHTLTLSQAMAHETPGKAVVISFDDGYDNFLSEAWPLLKARGMTATVFLVTGQLGGNNAWDISKGEPEERLLTRDQVLDLAAQGVEFGGHTHGHLNLTQVDPESLAREMVSCQKELTALLGEPAKVFSYPFGAFDQRAVEAVRQAGFAGACTTRPGKLTSETPLLKIPRIIVKRSDDLMDFRIKLYCGRSRL